MTALHVAPSGGKWSVRRAGATRALKLFPSKPEALGFAMMAPIRPIYVHDEGGRISEVIRE